MKCLALIPVAAAAAFAQTYSYDAAGRMVRAVYPNGIGVVYAYDAADNLTASASISPPAAPTDVSVTRTSPTTAQLTWRPGSGNTSGYILMRRLAGGGEWVQIAAVPAGTTTYIDATLSASADYVYRVAATNNDGPSAYSRELGPSSGHSINLSIATRGARTLSTLAVSPNQQTGYATVDVEAGSIPYGAAIFSVTNNGVVVSEAAVPASPPTARGRVFIDQRTRVAAPGRQYTGTIDVVTGIGIVNPAKQAANVDYTLRDSQGQVLASGKGSLAAGAHVAAIASDLGAIAAGFQFPADFATRIRYGSLDIESDQPLSIMALRATINQRNELLFTSTPVADLTQAATKQPVYFPHFTDGGGFTTTVILLNTSSSVETGTLEVLGDSGTPLSITAAGGAAGSRFDYTVQPGGTYVLESDGSSAEVRNGWVRAIPAQSGDSPVGAGVFRLGSGGVVITEAGVPSATLTTRALIFADKSNARDTGVAIANPAAAAANITVRAFHPDGATPAGSGPGAFALAAAGHRGEVVGNLISGLPAGFTGVLEVSSTTPFAALGLRALFNSRGDLLLSTLPVADQTQPAPAPVIFPHIADGGGFRTELILLGPITPADTRVRFFGDDGAPLDIGRMP